MTNYREILRLHSLGLNKTEIAASCGCARNTVAATLQRAENCGLQWPLPEEMSDMQLSERLFPASASKPVYKMPDYSSALTHAPTHCFCSVADAGIVSRHCTGKATDFCCCINGWSPAASNGRERKARQGP